MREERRGLADSPVEGAQVVPALTLAVVAISFAAIFFRLAAPTPPIVAAGTRLAVAALLLSPLVFRARRAGRLPNTVLRSAVLAGVAYAVHFGTWVTSLSMTSVAASVTLVTATPVILALVGIVSRRDAPERRHLLALALAAAGLLLVGGSDLADPAALRGDALALVGAAAMAAYMLLARRHGDSLDSWAYSGVATFVGAVILLGAASVSGTAIAFPGWKPFGFVVLAALLPQLVGHGLLTWTLRHARPTKVGIATLTEPVGATLLAWAFLAERAAALTLVGCAVTLIGVALAVWRPSSPQTPQGLVQP